MPITRFSPFELVLLQSHSQVDAATLLLQAWVLTHRNGITAGQRYRRLAQEAAELVPSDHLQTLMQIAAEHDIQAVQLAAEVLRHESPHEQGMAVMHRTISVATDDGQLSLANHYILRFIADLLGLTPATLETLFEEIAGAPLTAPQDPSRDAYWREHNPAHYRRRAEREAEAERAREEAEQADARRDAERREREQASQQKKQARRDRARAKQERRQRQQEEKDQRRRRDAYERQAHDRRQREEQYRRHQSDYRDRQHQGTHGGHRAQASASPDRTLRALAVLGLSRGASRSEIRRAYRRMAQMHHPDRFVAESESRAAQASMRFQRIKKAHDYLMKTL